MAESPERVALGQALGVGAFEYRALLPHNPGNACFRTFPRTGELACEMWGTALIMGDRSSPLASSREDPHGQTQLPHMLHCRILRPGNWLGTALSFKARILVQSHPNPSSSGWHHPWTRTISASALTTSGRIRGGLAVLQNLPVYPEGYLVFGSCFTESSFT